MFIVIKFLLWNYNFVKTEQFCFDVKLFYTQLHLFWKYDNYLKYFIIK